MTDSNQDLKTYAEIEERVRESDADLYLRADVLSVTSASEINDSGRHVSDWKKDGVSFLYENECLQQVITHAQGVDNE